MRSHEEETNVYPKITLEFATLEGSKSAGFAKRRPVIRPYPSQALCQRKIVLESDYEGETEPSDIGFPLYTQFGVVAEKYLKDSWKKYGILKASSIRIPEDPVLNVGGEIDAVVELNGEIRIVEIKTCDGLPVKPKPDHMFQARTYSALTGLPFTIFYLSRNIFEYSPNKKLKCVQFDYPYNDDLSFYQVLQIAKAKIFGDAGFIPPIPTHLTAKSHCGFCRFTKVCWNGGILPIESFTVKAPDLKTEIELEKEAMAVTSKYMKKSTVKKRRNEFLKRI